MKLLIVVGTRPNFVKVTQFKTVARDYDNIEIRIVHTGQHVDENMSKVFFSQFELEPDFYLPLTKSEPTSQMGEVMVGLEAKVQEYGPDLIMVVGDVNSTLAGAIASSKMMIPLAHLESGLRSGDRTMPEEINRILTDQISDLLFVTEQSGMDNIGKENLGGAAHFVGNTMIDTLVAFEDKISSSTIRSDLGLRVGDFGLMTMHRPATVDNESGLKDLLELVKSLTTHCPLVFPIHPRTLKNLRSFGLEKRINEIKDLIVTDPMDYFAFQNLVNHAKYVITDSGGIQEETTFRRVPCITLRPATERPSTTELGTNTIARFDPDEITRLITEIEEGSYRKGQIPPLWDGRATGRVMDILSGY